MAGDVALVGVLMAEMETFIQTYLDWCAMLNVKVTKVQVCSLAEAWP